ncbi:hypothetical protein SAMN06272735_8480 [Streptomyces sp. TLI_55]|nr:hypothetical protein SAMN06272735_8480 [Streptomyces sp. TLI_55]
MRQSRTTSNRPVIGSTGPALLTPGGWLAPFDTTLAQLLPARRPEPSAAHDVLPDADRRVPLRDAVRRTPAVLAAAIAPSVLFRCRFLAQIGSRPAQPVSPDTPKAPVRAPALAEALAARAMPGDARSRARVLPHSRRCLVVRLRVRREPDTSLRDMLPHLCALPAEARESAAPYSAHTRLRPSAVSKHVPHVR